MDGKVDYEAMLVAKLDEIRAALEDIAEILRKKNNTQIKTNGRRNLEREENRVEINMTPDEFKRYIKEMEPGLYKMIKDVRQFPSGDLIVEIKKLSNKEYREFADYMKDQFNARWNSKYRGFIVKQSG